MAVKRVNPAFIDGRLVRCVECWAQSVLKGASVGWILGLSGCSSGGVTIGKQASYATEQPRDDEGSGFGSLGAQLYL